MDVFSEFFGMKGDAYKVLIYAVIYWAGKMINQELTWEFIDPTVRYSLSAVSRLPLNNGKWLCL